MIRVLLSLFLVFTFLSPAAVAGDAQGVYEYLWKPDALKGQTPKRLWANPADIAPAAGKASPDGGSNFVLGFEPQVKVTGTPRVEPDAAFVMKVKDKWPKCRLAKMCGNVGYVDCGAATDGRAYYISAQTLETIAECGGACMNPNASCDCPPAAWTCQ